MLERARLVTRGEKWPLVCMKPTRYKMTYLTGYANQCKSGRNVVGVANCFIITSEVQHIWICTVKGSKNLCLDHRFIGPTGELTTMSLTKVLK